MPTPQEAANYAYTYAERELIEQRLSATVLGSPRQVHDRLDALARETGVDELMVTTMTHAHADRVRSYELVAGGHLDPLGAGPSGPGSVDWPVDSGVGR